mmetsp:Transcript_8427/g.11158  ORF Transcript_8427/g.11158 Transcript_8427/m.11158 type:complete len:390 (-) Transcript_8427:68-1237(-)
MKSDYSTEEDRKPSSLSPPLRSRRPTRAPNRLSAADSFLEDDIKRAIQASLKPAATLPPRPRPPKPSLAPAQQEQHRKGIALPDKNKNHRGGPGQRGGRTQSYDRGSGSEWESRGDAAWLPVGKSHYVPQCSTKRGGRTVTERRPQRSATANLRGGKRKRQNLSLRKFAMFDKGEHEFALFDEDEALKRAIKESLKDVENNMPVPGAEESLRGRGYKRTRSSNRKRSDEEEQAEKGCTIPLRKRKVQTKAVHITEVDDLEDNEDEFSPQGSPGRPLPPKKSTLYIGVRQAGTRYTAYIRIRDKERFIGWFPTSIEAAKAYDEMAIQLFEDKAQLNFERKDDGTLPVFGFGLTETKKVDSTNQRTGASKIRKLLSGPSRRNSKGKKKKKV